MHKPLLAIDISCDGCRAALEMITRMLKIVQQHNDGLSRALSTLTEGHRDFLPIYSKWSQMQDVLRQFDHVADEIEKDGTIDEFETDTDPEGKKFH